MNPESCCHCRGPPPSPTPPNRFLFSGKLPLSSFQLPNFLCRLHRPLNELFSFDKYVFIPLWAREALPGRVAVDGHTEKNLSIWPKSRFTSFLSTEMNGPLARCNFFTSHMLPLQRSLSQQIPNHLRYTGL